MGLEAWFAFRLTADMTSIDPSSIEIRFASPADCEALSEIGRETFTRKFGHLYSAENLSKFLEEDHAIAAYEQQIADPAIGVWKALDTKTGRMIGYAVGARKCLLPADNMPERAGEVKRLYLRDEAQGSGLGAKMLQIMLDWILADGPCPVYLSVYKYNDGAQRFYDRFGFSKHKEYEFMVGDHADPEYIFMRP